MFNKLHPVTWIAALCALASGLYAESAAEIVAKAARNMQNANRARDQYTYRVTSVQRDLDERATSSRPNKPRKK